MDKFSLLIGERDCHVERRGAALARCERSPGISRFVPHVRRSGGLRQLVAAVVVVASMVSAGRSHDRLLLPQFTAYLLRSHDNTISMLGHNVLIDADASALPTECDCNTAP